jgi:hypothetical protein
MPTVPVSPVPPAAITPETHPFYSAFSGGTPSPWYQSNSIPWDSIVVGGVVWLGKVEIHGAKRFYKWDTKPTPGGEGWSDAYIGTRPKPFHIRFYIWSDSMYAYFVNMILPIFQNSGVKSLVKAFTVNHPSLQNLNINALVTDYIGAIEKVSDDMMFMCEIEVHEHQLPVPLDVTTTPLAALGYPAVLPGGGIPPVTATSSAALLVAAAAAEAAVLADTLPSGL